MDQTERFEKLMRESYQRVYGHAYRLSKSRVEAEDLTQDAYVRAFKAFGQYNPEKSFENWLFRIVSRLHLDLLRYKGRRPLGMSLDAPLEGTVYEGCIHIDPSPGPHEIVEGRLLEDACIDSLKDLSPFANRLMRGLIEGTEYKDLAKMEERPIGSVRSTIFRARKKLALVNA